MSAKFVNRRVSTAKKKLNKKSSKPRMILDKIWDDNDLKALASSHGKKPKRFLEDRIVDMIRIFKDRSPDLFAKPKKQTAKK